MRKTLEVLKIYIDSSVMQINNKTITGWKALSIFILLMLIYHGLFIGLGYWIGS